LNPAGGVIPGGTGLGLGGFFGFGTTGLRVGEGGSTALAGFAVGLPVGGLVVTGFRLGGLLTGKVGFAVGGLAVVGLLPVGLAPGGFPFGTGKGLGAVKPLLTLLCGEFGLGLNG